MSLSLTRSRNSRTIYMARPLPRHTPPPFDHVFPQMLSLSLSSHTHPGSVHNLKGIYHPLPVSDSSADLKCRYTTPVHSSCGQFIWIDFYPSIRDFHPGRARLPSTLGALFSHGRVLGVHSLRSRFPFASYRRWPSRLAPGRWFQRR